MRVRKAVPEGYQTATTTKKKHVGGGASAAAVCGARRTATGKTASSSSRQFAASASAAGVTAGVIGGATGGAGAGVYTGHRSRELTPYCGLLKVGGYDSPSPTSSPPDVGDVPALLRWDEEEEEAERNGQPLLSQESMVSDYCSDDDANGAATATDTFSPADIVNPLKRRQLDFDDDNDDGVDGVDEVDEALGLAKDPEVMFILEDAHHEHQVVGISSSMHHRPRLASPHASTPVAQGRIVRSCCLPSKAALNARQRGQGTAGDSGPSYAHGNLGASSSSPLDFGDAPFLQPSEYTTYTEDALMSGI
jgi:hypothetical protein